MTEKTQVEICFLLPDGSSCQSCIDRLLERVAAHDGVEVTHVDAEGDSPRLCVHYDPEQVGAGQLQAIMAEEGARLEAQYHHETLAIAGMDCPDCARTLESGVGRLEGVAWAAANFAGGTLSLEYDAGRVDRRAIDARVRSLGYAIAEEETPEEQAYQVAGLDCADCARHLEDALRNVPGIAGVRVDFGLARAWITASKDAGVEAAAQRVAQAMGYALIPKTAQSAEGKGGRQAWLRQHRRALTTAASGLLVLAAAGLHLLRAPEPAVAALYIAAIVAGGFTVARAGWASLRSARSLDMNALMSIAAAGSILVGEWEEGAVAIFLFSLGNLLESYTMDRARNAIRGLMDLSPRRGTLLHGDREEQVPVESLRPGDRILVRPGERIPMDGQVLAGESSVNQAPITGESLPADKSPGSEVYAGTVNGQGALTVRVGRLSGDSTISRIIRMVEEAQAQKAPSQRFVDRFARVYTPIVIAVAVAVALLPPLAGGLSGQSFGALFPQWLYRALVLLVIACPCALVISTPVTIVSGIARLARAGVLVKGGRHLEALGGLRVIALDKTGTLTAGMPQVAGVRCLDHRDGDPWQTCEECRRTLATAAAVERRSEHPIGLAVVRAAAGLGLVEGEKAAVSVQALAGRGVRGRVNGHSVTIGAHAFFHESHPDLADGPLCAAAHAAEASGQTTMIVRDDCCGLLGIISVADTLRPGARDAVLALSKVGIEHTVMLTGDNESTARAIAATAGVSDVRAGLLPEQKVEAIEELLAQYGAVAMVGDGVNDAPALARATVGIAMGAAGSDTALETADVALMADDLGRLPFAVRLSRRTRSVILQNVVLALGIKAVFLALAIAGLATMWMAVFADMGASLLVTLNGMRLLRQK